MPLQSQGLQISWWNICCTQSPMHLQIRVNYQIFVYWTQEILYLGQSSEPSLKAQGSSRVVWKRIENYGGERISQCWLHRTWETHDQIKTRIFTYSHDQKWCGWKPDGFWILESSRWRHRDPEGNRTCDSQKASIEVHHCASSIGSEKESGWSAWVCK